ncbi:MAG TPA: flagellar hook-basal body complex protein FliE [Desulfobacterales bacterium]|nr:flagellar hook-basal body complex protein FliE [Desulfobacterales bacterium]
MADGILTRIAPAGGQKIATGDQQPTAKDPTGFGNLLRRSLDAVNRSAAEADQMVAGLVSGEHANIHETILAMEKAGLQMRLLVRAQNKVVDAYKEIMRMQL